MNRTALRLTFYDSHHPSFYLRPLIDGRILQYPAVSTEDAAAASSSSFLSVSMVSCGSNSSYTAWTLLSVQRTQAQPFPIQRCNPHQPPSLTRRRLFTVPFSSYEGPSQRISRDLEATSRKSQIFQQGGAQVCVYDISGRCARVIPGQLNQRKEILRRHSPRPRPSDPDRPPIVHWKTAAQSGITALLSVPVTGSFHLQAGSLRRVLFRPKPLICDLLFTSSVLPSILAGMVS